MNPFTQWKMRREIRGYQLEAQYARTKALANLTQRQTKLMEAWGAKGADYEMGWNDAIKSGLNQTDHKNPVSFSFVVDTMIGVSRELFIKNPFAQSAVLNLQHYIVGTGFSYRKTGAEKEKAKLISDYWQAWCKTHDWPLIENEVVKRGFRDGFLIIRWFGDEPRFVEPRQLAPNREAPWGIITDPKDGTKVLKYRIAQVKPDGSLDPANVDEVPADQVQMLKWPLVDANCVLGLPPLYFFAANLNRADRCLRNMGELVAIQTAIAIIKEHPEGVSGTEIDAWAVEAADKQVEDPDTGKTVLQRKFLPGTMLETRAGEKIHFPAANMRADSFIAVVAADLRAVAAGMALPEFMLTADASSSNYASLMAAEGPAVKTFESLQKFFGGFFAEAFDRVMAVAVKKVNPVVEKRYPQVFKPLGEEILKFPTSVTGPSVRTRDFFTEARANLIESQAGVQSPQGWCNSKNRDYDETMSQIEEHKAAHPDIPWPPTTQMQAGAALEEHPDMKPAAPAGDGPKRSQTKTGSENRDAGGSGA